MTAKEQKLWYQVQQYQHKTGAGRVSNIPALANRRKKSIVAILAMK